MNWLIKEWSDEPDNETKSFHEEHTLYPNPTPTENRVSL